MTKLIKSKSRVQKHGEVFTPDWMVKMMLSEPAIQAKIKDIRATFFEPSVGEGAFVTEILHQKLNHVDEISSKGNWIENALWVVASIYGIELLTDNLIIAKQNLIEVLIEHYQNFYQKELSRKSDLYKSARYIIDNNIVQGNALTYLNNSNGLIVFSEWVKQDDKVKQLQFTFKSLVEDNFNSFDINRQIELLDEDKPESNGFIKITKVYKNKLGGL
ncbi:methylase [Ligilactobacillus salivarius]|uniref:methylase n=1 Tax=Ligilactobacillus salivarius TaxID=1624 RepID=UPI00191D3F34|nr:methylase [Ligilactobacillus salivarius]MBL1057970.1 methylase [Ligilactobacillus salivarius]